MAAKCNCNSICLKKGGRGACPCAAAGMFCGLECGCGEIRLRGKVLSCWNKKKPASEAKDVNSKDAAEAKTKGRKRKRTDSDAETSFTSSKAKPSASAFCTSTPKRATSARTAKRAASADLSGSRPKRTATSASKPASDRDPSTPKPAAGATGPKLPPFKFAAASNSSTSKPAATPGASNIPTSKSATTAGMSANKLFATPNSKTSTSRVSSTMPQPSTGSTPTMTSSPSVSSSPSECFRRKGNEQFSTIQSLAPVFQASRLTQALVWYNKALSSAVSIVDKLSALKNVAVASSKLSRLTVNMKSEQVLFYGEQSISSFTEALSVAEGDASRKEWCDDVKKRLYDQVSHYLDLLDDEDDTVREQKQLALCKLVHVSAKSLCFLDLAKMYFRRALEFQEQKKFEKSLPLFSECYGPLTEASKYLSSAYEDEYNVDEDSIEDLQGQVHVTEAAARALQAIHTGDELYKKAVFEAEILDVDLLWGCMDWYQQAIVYSNIYCDLETEAIASCRIGIIYLRVLKMTEKGYSRLKHAFDLAESMKPRYFVNDEWYKLCVAAMQEHQTEKRRKEEQERAKSKAPYLEKLKDELALIREKSDKSPYDLLKHVYEKHPPKNDAKLPDDIKPEQLKKTLKHALAHYHPDKNAECNFGMEWSVLAEEISKYISSHYERQKGF